jgi:N-acetyl-anhydromuramyl-L-alanine amidase AmpD
MDTFNIPAERVKGHREIYPRKTCPGMNFDLNLFRDSLRVREG